MWLNNVWEVNNNRWHTIESRLGAIVTTAHFADSQSNATVHSDKCGDHLLTVYNHYPSQSRLGGPYNND